MIKVKIIMVIMKMTIMLILLLLLPLVTVTTTTNNTTLSLHSLLKSKIELCIKIPKWKNETNVKMKGKREKEEIRKDKREKR